jgi:VTC domain
MVLTKLLEKKGEFELKYTFPNMSRASLESWLLVNCKKDPSYPESRVHSIYLETTLAESYQEKVNSDFFKTKYRVRWYENEFGQPFSEGPIVPVFLENKMKIGSKRLKNRWVVDEKFDNLKTHNLNSIFHSKWYKLFLDFKDETIPNLHPFIQISYTRKRFIDSITNTRLSLDYDIRVERTNSILLPPAQKVALDVGVFEVKSKSNVPPQSLSYLTTNLVKKANFSKYGECVSSVEM